MYTSQSNPVSAVPDGALDRRPTLPRNEGGTYLPISSQFMRSKATASDSPKRGGSE